MALEGQLLTGRMKREASVPGILFLHRVMIVWVLSAYENA